MTVKYRKSTCPYCGFGCGLMVGVENGKVVEVKGMEGHPVNDGDICVLAANYPPIFTDKDRLKQSTIRRDGKTDGTFQHKDLYRQIAKVEKDSPRWICGRLP